MCDVQHVQPGQRSYTCMKGHHPRNKTQADWVLVALCILPDLLPEIVDSEYVIIMEGPDKEMKQFCRQMLLSLRHGWPGLSMHSDEVLVAAFVVADSEAERSLKGRLTAMFPVRGVRGRRVCSGERERP